MPRLPLRRHGWLMHILLLAVPLGLCAVLMRIHPGAMPDFSATRDVFRFRDGVWTSTHLPTGGVDQLRVSRSGDVWTTTASRAGLRRLHGDRWIPYAARESGATASRFRGGFALSGDEVFGATREGVVRSDGQGWRLYTEALKTRRPAATVAGLSGVWIVDDYGNLSHFDGSSWTIRDLKGALPGGPSEIDEDTLSPDLAMTADGRVWIFWDRLWLQEGKTWREIRPEGIDLRTFAWLVGHDADRVWLARAGELVAVRADGSVAARYTAGDLGIPESARIHRVAVSGESIWVATTGDLLSLKAGRWRHFGRPPGTAVVRDVAAGPDESAWVVAEKRSLATIALWIAPPLAACAIALTVIGLLITMWVRGMAENRLAAEQAVANAAGYLPGVDAVADRAAIERQSRSMSWKLPLVLVAVPNVIFAVSAGARLLERRWPGAPWWMLYAGVLAPVVLAGIAIWLWRSRRPQQPGSSRYKQIIWKPARYLLYFAVFTFVTRWTPLGWVDRIISNSTVAHLAKFVVIIVILSLIFAARDIAAQLLAKAAWRTGNYDGALRRLRWLSLGSPTPIMLDLQGITLSLAGRLPDAEQCYRQALAKNASAPRSTKVRLLCCLGDVLKDLGRYDEARRCFENAVAMGDPEGIGRVSMAELYLEQGIEPQKAFDLLDEAMRAKGKAVGQLQGGRWAHKAWALALLGRRREADEAIERAWKATPGASPRPVLAIRHWTVGMALLVMERTGQAIEHFRAARDADPKGKYGGLAMQQLKLHSQWGQ